MRTKFDIYVFIDYIITFVFQKDQFELATVNGSLNHGFESSETKMEDFGERKYGGVIHRNGQSNTQPSRESFTQL